MKQAWILLFFPILMQACVSSCDCFDDCAEVITFQLDTTAGQFSGREIENLEIHIQLENENEWRHSTLDTNNYSRFTFDSIYSLVFCGAPFHENYVHTGLYAGVLNSKDQVKIEHIRFITTSDTASLNNLDLIIRKSGRVRCKCIETLTFKYEQGGEHYAIKSEASRHHIIAKVQVD